MKKSSLKELTALAAVCVLFYTSSCNPGSEKQNETDTFLSREAYLEQVEGVYEYLPPFQGCAIMINGHYVYMYGRADSTMYCHAGTYTVSGDTITNEVLFAFDPTQLGTVFNWKSKLISGDTIVAEVFDKEGNITQTAKSIKKLSADKASQESLKDYEGIFRYVDRLQGQSIMYGGYHVFLYGNSDSTMYAHAGTYISENDTVTNKILYAKNPETVGNEFSWTTESIIGDTATYALVNNKGEVTGRGRSLKIK